MSRPLSSLFALYTLTPGRRIYALGRVRERADAFGFPELIEAIETARDHDRKTLELDAARLERTKSTARGHDSKVDRTLVAIERLLGHYAHTEQSDTASALLSTLFPRGLAQHISLPHVEQAAANERVLGVLDSNSHGAWLEEHGFGRLIKQLHAAHKEFAAALHARDATDSPSWEDVKAARETGQELYLQIVARIIVRFIDDADAREQVMEPIWDQDRLIRAHRRRRRSIVDVDPDSGEALELSDGSDEELQGPAEPEVAEQTPPSEA